MFDPDALAEEICTDLHEAMTFYGPTGQPANGDVLKLVQPLVAASLRRLLGEAQAAGGGSG